jgi:hypothetical protein
MDLRKIYDKNDRELARGKGREDYMHAFSPAARLVEEAFGMTARGA